MTQVSLNYKPRWYFESFHNRDKRFFFMLAHRRAGKSYAIAADMVNRALRTKKKNAQFAYCAPSLKQARQIIWKHLQTIIGDGLLSQCRVSLDRLSIVFPNGSEIRVFGLNDPDALRGFYLDGICIDEAQDISQELLSTVIMPALADRRGWMIVSGTPKGTGNSFYRLYRKAVGNTERWGRVELKASDTKIIPEEELAIQREELSPEDYEQEYELSFVSGNYGSIHGKYMDLAETEGRIVDFDFVHSAPVHLSFDLGRDTTAIWFLQLVNGRVDIIDYLQSIGSELSDDLATVREHAKNRGYKIGTVFLPHDCYDRNYINGKTMQEVFWKEGFETRPAPDVSVKTGINSARSLLKICRIHRTNCFQGMEALRAYRYTFNDAAQVFSSTPLHDWASHAADSFRYMSLSISEFSISQSINKITSKPVSSGIPTNVEQAKKNGYSDEELFFLGIGKYGGNQYSSWL